MLEGRFYIEILAAAIRIIAERANKALAEGDESAYNAYAEASVIFSAAVNNDVATLKFLS